MSDPEEERLQREVARHLAISRITRRDELWRRVRPARARHARQPRRT